MLRRYAPLCVDVCRTRKLTPWLITLTVKNGTDLEERFEHLRAAMHRMKEAAANYRSWKKTGRGRKRRFVEWSKIEGACYAIEVTKNEGTGEWHPHVHYVAGIAQGVHFDKWQLAEDWKRETGDSYIVDARPFHCADKLENITTPEEALDAMGSDLVEVLKYAVKFSSMDPADVWHAFKFIHSGNRRLLGRVGDFHAWTVDDNLLDAPLDTGDMPYVLAIARYMHTEYVVERRTVYPQIEECEVPF